MTVAAAKPKKQRDETRQRSLDLLAFWYRCRCADGSQRYHPDKTELTIAPPPSEGSKGPRYAKPEKLTAHGTESHRPDPSVLGSWPDGPSSYPPIVQRGGPWCYDDLSEDDLRMSEDEMLDGDHRWIDSRNRHAIRERHARAAMMHVINVHADLHRALEMHAAGWTHEEIAGELGCSVHKARTRMESGLAVISSFRILVKPG